MNHIPPSIVNVHEHSIYSHTTRDEKETEGSPRQKEKQHTIKVTLPAPPQIPAKPDSTRQDFLNTPLNKRKLLGTSTRERIYPDSIQDDKTLTSLRENQTADTSIETLTRNSSSPPGAVSEHERIKDLQASIFDGDMPRIENLIRENPELVSIVDNHGRTPLVYATWIGQDIICSKLRALIRKMPNVDSEIVCTQWPNVSDALKKGYDLRYKMRQSIHTEDIPKIRALFKDGFTTDILFSGFLPAPCKNANNGTWSEGDLSGTEPQYCNVYNYYTCVDYAALTNGQNSIHACL